MPTRVLRRTPASEKAAIYGYKDLLRDSIRYIGRKAGENVARMTSGGMSEGEVLEMALAPAGGMLKVAGTSKLLAGLLARQKDALFTAQVLRRSEEKVIESFVPTQRVFKEALKVSEKEYGRIKDISWSKMRGEALGTKGLYFPLEKDIALNPTTADVSTIWHEFTHARQWSPEKEEQAAAGVLRYINQQLAKKSGLSGGRDFYHNISPIEKHARNVGMTMTTGSKPSEFSAVYKRLHELALAEGEMRLRPQEVKEAWELFLRGKEMRTLKSSLPELAKKTTSKEELMKKFSKEGLRYDAFTEPMPGYGYHQWTLYGEGPAKGATFGTKTTSMKEMQDKITELIKKFSK